jgi:hypothetical protein
MSHRSEAANKPRASDALLRAELADLRALFQQAPATWRSCGAMISKPK